MSTSKESLLDYAKALVTHPAHEAMRERVQMRLFNRFRTANEEERGVIGDIMNAEAMFFTELKIVVDELSPQDDGDPEPDSVNT